MPGQIPYHGIEGVPVQATTRKEGETFIVIIAELLHCYMIGPTSHNVQSNQSGQKQGATRRTKRRAVKNIKICHPRSNAISAHMLEHFTLQSTHCCTFVINKLAVNIKNLFLVHIGACRKRRRLVHCMGENPRTGRATKLALKTFNLPIVNGRTAPSSRGSGCRK